MNTYQALKIIRDRLAKDLVEGKKSYEKLSRELEALTKQVRTIEATVAVNTRLITDLDNVLRNTSEAAVAQSQVKPKGKPGRKPKAKVEAATTEPKVRKKPGRKPKAETEAKPAAKAAKAPAKTPGKRGPKPRKGAAEGRRAVAEGLRPPIKDAIAKVMGGKTMSIDDIFEGLKAKSWLPNSSEPRQYISYLLSTSKDRFERVQGARGVYRPVSSDTKVEKTEKVEKKSKVTISTDDILASAGVLGDATFGG